MSLPNRPFTKKRAHKQPKWGQMLLALSQRPISNKLFRCTGWSRPLDMARHHSEAQDCRTFWSEYRHHKSSNNLQIPTIHHRLYSKDMIHTISIGCCFSVYDYVDFYYIDFLLMQAQPTRTSSVVARVGRVPWTWRATILRRRIVASPRLNTVTTSFGAVAPSTPRAVQFTCGAKAKRCATNMARSSRHPAEHKGKTIITKTVLHG